MVDEEGWTIKTRKKAKRTVEPKTVNDEPRRDTNSTSDKENSGAHDTTREDAAAKRQKKEKEQSATPRVTRAQIRALTDFELLRHDVENRQHNANVKYDFQRKKVEKKDVLQSKEYDYTGKSLAASQPLTPLGNAEKTTATSRFSGGSKHLGT